MFLAQALRLAPYPRAILLELEGHAQGFPEVAGCLKPRLGWKAPVQSGLSHNTLRVVLDGARPKAETCDALEPALHLAPGVLRLLAGWPLDDDRFRYDEQWVRTLLELAPWSRRQQVISYLLARQDGDAVPPRESRPGRKR